MAEGFSRKIINHKYNIHSAGIEAHGLNSMAVTVMRELGIDITGQRSKSISMDQLNKFDIIITLCGDAKDKCPSTPMNTKHIHWDLEDPANATGTHDEIINIYRKVRDQIDEKINSLI